MAGEKASRLCQHRSVTAETIAALDRNAELSAISAAVKKVNSILGISSENKTISGNFFFFNFMCLYDCIFNSIKDDHQILSEKEKNKSACSSPNSMLTLITKLLAIRYPLLKT